MSKKTYTRKRHIFTPKLTDAQIEEACRLLEAYEVATIPPEGTYAELRSDDYVAYMDTLMAQSRADTLTAPSVSMGWQYYMRKGIAMPERVMAGYKWLVEVVEEFFEDRKTEYRYTSNAEEEVEFVPMTFGYLPEGMEEVNIRKMDYTITWLFKTKNNEYIKIIQNKIRNNFTHVYGTNTEIYYTEIVLMGKTVIELSEKDGIIYFSYIHHMYHISGQTNIFKDELIKILNNLILS